MAQEVKLNAYFSDIRETRNKITEEWPLVISLQKPMKNMVGGVICEVSRDKAAQLIVDETHRLCTAEESAAWREEQDRLRQQAHAEAAAAKVTLVAVPATGVAGVAKQPRERDK